MAEKTRQEKNKKSLYITKRINYIFAELFKQERKTMGRVSGEIFTKEYIQNSYGQCEQAVTIKTKLLRKAIAECDEYVFFNIHGGNVIIAKSMKDFILPTKFNYVSKEVLKKFLDKTGLDDTEAEYSELQIRQKDYTFVIENGAHSLQNTLECPPHCP